MSDIERGAPPSVTGSAKPGRGQWEPLLGAARKEPGVWFHREGAAKSLSPMARRINLGTYGTTIDAGERWEVTTRNISPTADGPPTLYVRYLGTDDNPIDPEDAS